MTTTTFSGKTILVTGGASGIGRDLAAQLSAGGAHVTVADINETGVHATIELLASAARNAGGSLTGVVLDVSDAQAVQTAVDRLVATCGRIDLMFNNAGVSLGGPTHEMSATHFDHVINVNIRGVVNGVAAAYPHMVRQGNGHIVNTASMAGLVGPPMTVAYSMTKHAVVGLSTTLRPEARLHGVRVSVLCPGAVDTPILDSAPPPDLPARATPPLTGREFLALFRATPIAPEEFARRALRAVQRNRAIIIVPEFNRALWYASRLSPSLTQFIGNRMARRVVRRIKENPI